MGRTLNKLGACIHVSCRTAILLAVAACAPESALTEHPEPRLRQDSIPANAEKVSPGEDLHPPRSLTTEYLDPVPLPGPVNTAGAEDSAFVTPDGQTLYVWFTPDPSIPAEGQLGDGVTGVYVSHRADDAWGEPARVWLEDPEVLALDGCEFVLGPVMWFCTVREGFTGIQWFTAHWIEGQWADWAPASFPTEYEIGELHLTSDGQELYFHSSRPGGLGEFDIWMSSAVDHGWDAPVNVRNINSGSTDGWPFISFDGNELWFTRAAGAPSLWRSKRSGNAWGPPEEMFGPFSGEASMDAAGNVYFTHHYYHDDQMLEADIYIARPARN